MASKAAAGSSSPKRKPLKGHVAVVAGATRGAGRGIATALGEAGATVYCTGRSVKGRPSEMKRPETIEETAERVTAAGGEGVAVRVDHLKPDQVRGLFDRVQKEAGRLDLLVNDVWGGDPLTEWGKPFWKLDPAKGLAMLETAVHTHLITARYGAPLMVQARRGIIVEVTDGDGFWYRGNLYYDLVKTTVIRTAFDMSEELRRHGVTSLAVTPGFLRSEAMLEHFGVKEANWRDGAKKDANFAASETPLFVGRAVAALAADPEVAKKTGRVYASWTLAKEYGFTDADGSRPDWGAHFRRRYGADILPEADDRYYAYWEGYERLARAFKETGETFYEEPPEPL